MAGDNSPRHILAKSCGQISIAGTKNTKKQASGAATCLFLQAGQAKTPGQFGQHSIGPQPLLGQHDQGMEPEIGGLMDDLIGVSSRPLL